MRRASDARRRALQDLKAAARNEALADGPGGELRASAAAMLRRSAARHAAAAHLQEAHARRLATWMGRPGDRPRFMSGVADLFGTRSATLTVVGSDLDQLASAASDSTAKAAQELEFALGSGPAADATSGGLLVQGTGAELERRWPGYGAGLAELGVGTVVAVPLLSTTQCLGALTVFDPQPYGDRPRPVSYDEMAAVLTRMLLGPDAEPELHLGMDLQEVVHQATGMVSVQCGCGVDDALSLIKARAFALGETTTAVAAQIVHEGLRIGLGDAE
ncbi:ANTAR domain-containing protein [Streptomyces sp. A7024]|uniref:ANTAR domain-containing protein n=2 Tax=Streptomyces coryli TaxID=1128680 RepID=A0A6G4U5K6_9ACTN|nr:ANTAR domain-containing protein [Streptomyces coryli]NGN66668.1 ANTAR domain-containing protein [Streptomyces coryli]